MSLIDFSRQTGQPVYGLPGTYYIEQTRDAQGEITTGSIALLSNAHIICLPGCKIVRTSTFQSGVVGVLSGGTRTAPIENARWIGGEFIGEKDGSGHYPPGLVISLYGHGLYLKDITVDGFGYDVDGGAGPAMALWGNRIRVINPRIFNPYVVPPAAAAGGASPPTSNGAGIRLYGGTNFRCYGGEVHSGGDGALQFCAFNAARYSNDNPGDAILDGAFIGTRCYAVDGRIAQVGPGRPTIRQVRYVDITGTTTGNGAGLNVGTGGQFTTATEAVVFRNITLERQTTDAGEAIRLNNGAADAGRVLSDVRYENVRVITPPTTTAGNNESIFVAGSPVPIGAATDPGPLRNVSWLGGGANGVDLLNRAHVLDVRRLTNGLFEGLRLEGDSKEAPVSLGGMDVDKDGNPKIGDCRTTALVDTVLSSVRYGESGVQFAAATGCAWVRGTVSQAGGAATAFQVDAAARRCTVEGAGLAGIAADFAIATGATFRIGANHPGSLATDLIGKGRRTALQLGVDDQTVASGAVSTRAGGVTLAPGAPPGALTAINGAATGALLVARGKPGAAAVTVAEGGNLRLATPSVPLDDTDALALVRLQDGWAELSRGVN